MGQAEFRWDTLHQAWVIIAGDRGDRPNEFAASIAELQSSDYPFCAGNESQTPPAIATYPEGADDWKIRVIPNKYPAVSPSDAPLTSADRMSRDWQNNPAVGRHEIIVESPEHLTSLTELSEEQVQLALCVYRDRLAEARDDQQMFYRLLFKNTGASAGASIAHTHAQLIALPMIPLAAMQRRIAMQAYAQEHLRCLMCDEAVKEQASSRHILSNDAFVAFCPYASRFPGEIRIVPFAHETQMADYSDEQLLALGPLLIDVLRRVEKGFPGVGYNLMIHSNGYDEPTPHAHWYLEIVPRLANLAGYELGSGGYINPMTPEDAAATLRSATS